MVPGEGERAALNLYSGLPGIILFLLEFHYATGDPEYLQQAHAGARLLGGAFMEGGEFLEQAGLAEGDPSVSGPGLYTGQAGAAFALSEAFRGTGDQVMRSEAVALFENILEAGRVDGEELAWYDEDPDTASYDIISGSAGIGLSLLYAHQSLAFYPGMDAAVRVGRHLVRRARPAEVGLKWPMSEANPRLMPNFSHGTAGVAYFLTRLATFSGDEEFLDAAIQGARYLQAVARCRDDGCLIFHHEPGGEDLFYLGWCHGPPGTTRLFYQLSRVTGEEEWMEWVHRGAKGIRDQGIPEVRTEGFWNNVSQCCGDAGVGSFFLSLAAATENEVHADFARRLGDHIMSEASEEGEGVRWVQAEHRTRPDFLQAQTGWMQGASGVGAFFLHLDGAAKGRPPQIRFPDSPWLG
jgi:lantibiotic modifying enzyme